MENWWHHVKKKLKKETAKCKNIDLEEQLNQESRSKEILRVRNCRMRINATNTMPSEAEEKH